MNPAPAVWSSPRISLLARNEVNEAAMAANMATSHAGGEASPVVYVPADAPPGILLAFALTEYVTAIELSLASATEIVIASGTVITEGVVLMSAVTIDRAPDTAAPPPGPAM